VIAHRFNYRDADLFLVMQYRQCDRKCTHSELLAMNGFMPKCITAVPERAELDNDLRRPGCDNIYLTRQQEAHLCVFLSFLAVTWFSVLERFKHNQYAIHKELKRKREAFQVRT
jgi:hypothetical protein